MLFQICSLLRGGIAERGGVRVGHRIIEINNQSVVAVPHEKIVNLLATSVGEVGLHSTFFITKIISLFKMFLQSLQNDHPLVTQYLYVRGKMREIQQENRVGYKMFFFSSNFKPS